MNRQNVESLWHELQRAVSVAGPPPSVGHDAYCLTLAEIIASRGVLVPSALTDEQGHMAGDYWAAGSDTDSGPIAKGVRALLERIAKGEAT